MVLALSLAIDLIEGLRLQQVWALVCTELSSVSDNSETIHVHPTHWQVSADESGL